MLRYLEEVFGVKSELEKWDGKRKLPLYLRGKREYYVLSFQNQKNLLIKVSTESFNMVTFRKQILQLNQYTELDIILWMETITAYQRQVLIKNRIPFIVPGSQIFVPEWGMCLKEYYASHKENTEKMTASAQYLLLYFIYRKENEEKSQKELADKLGMSEMQVSRAVQELTQFHLVTVLREGKIKL